MIYVGSHRQRGGIFTKACAKGDNWVDVPRLIGHHTDTEFIAQRMPSEAEASLPKASADKVRISKAPSSV